MSVNQAIADRFELISQMLELLGEDRFRVAANARAARNIEGLSVDLASIADDKKKLTEIDGVGPKIADKITEFCQTGKIKELEELRKRVPKGLIELLAVPGLGPKTVALLWKERDVTTLAKLKKIIKDGSILELPRMGAKSVEKIADSIELMEHSGDRLALGPAQALAEHVVERLSAVKGVKRAAYAGSLRRGRETVGDIDILVATTEPKAASEAFRKMKHVEQVIAAGETKSSVRMRVGNNDDRWGDDGKTPTVQVDLRVLPEESWGAGLLYFTGSKEHNVRLRERALKKKLTLNEYGLFPLDDDKTPPQKRGVKPVASREEKDIYKALGVPYLPPEIREDRGELDLSETPDLIELDDIKAELHAHTTASDGRLSIEQLAQDAKRRGFHTIAVTDHSKSSAVANGLSPDRLREHIEAVREADSKIKGISILAGSEVDILADGSLDYDDDLLAELDVVVASPHASLSQDAETATKRLVKAVRHPLVHILGHPTGRLINRRRGLSPDIAAVIEAAVDAGTALEINAHWMRLDLRDAHVRAATDAGALIAIDCDVHAAADFDNLRFGVATARRGWVTAKRCINTWPQKKLHDWLKAKRPAKTR